MLSVGGSALQAECLLFIDSWRASLGLAQAFEVFKLFGYVFSFYNYRFSMLKKSNDPALTVFLLLLERLEMALDEWKHGRKERTTDGPNRDVHGIRRHPERKSGRQMDEIDPKTPKQCNHPSRHNHDKSIQTWSIVLKLGEYTTNSMVN